QSRKRDSEFISLEKNGLLARNDLLRSQLQTSNFELGLVDAQNSIQLATVNMNLMLGLAEATVIVPDSASITKPSELKTIEEYEQLASVNRNDVQALTYRQKAADAAIKVAQGDYYPSLNLTGGYIAADIPGFLTITNAVTLGVGVKYDLGSLWKTKSKVQQAQAREQQVKVNQDILTDNIHLDINHAYQDYLSGLKKIEVGNKAVEQANENYRISKNKYDNNLLLLTDLLDANVLQLRARLDLSISKADAVLAYYTLQQTAGVLK
ncbi:MAG TPA: TolC family protein, partial [Chitinophagaceae bacterium]